MPDHDLRVLLEDYAASFERATRPRPPAVVRRRGRQLRLRRRLTILAVAAAVVAAGVVVASDLPDLRGDAAPVLDRPRPAPTTMPAPAKPTQRPAAFVAYDNVNERIALVATSSGKTLRYLTPSKLRTGDFRLSADHRTVYLAEWGSADFDCVQSIDWRPFSMATGRPGGGTLQLSDLWAKSLDGRTTAEVRNRRVGGDCQRTLVVRDEATETEHSWPLPKNMLIQTLELSPDGRRVAWQSTDLDDSVYGPDKLPDDGLLEVGKDRAVLQLMPPPVEHAGCTRSAPRFDPADGHLLLIDSCDGRKPELLELDPDSDQVLRRTPLDLDFDPSPMGDSGWVFSLALDASGQHILIEGSGSEVRTLSGGRIKRLPGLHLSPEW